MRVTHSAAALLACLCITASALACKTNAADEGTAKCRSRLSSFTSPAPGTLTMRGQFYSDESILLYDTDRNALAAQGTPATDRTSFTFTGLPSGKSYYVIKVSCASGQENLDEGEITIL